MKVRKQSGLPTTPPHIGDDELLLDESTGRLHYNDGTQVQPVGGRRFVGWLNLYFDGPTSAWINPPMRNDFGDTNPVVTHDADYEGEGYGVFIVTLPNAATVPEDEIFVTVQATNVNAGHTPTLIATPNGAGAVLITALKSDFTETDDITLLLSIEHVK